MKKNLIKILLLIVLIVLFILIIKNEYKRNSKDEYNNYIEITVNTNGGVPFRWKYEIQDSNIVKYVKEYEIENQNNGKLVGAPIKTNYVFEGLKEGQTKVTFRYVNFINGEIGKEIIYDIKVDENKNISIINE